MALFATNKEVNTFNTLVMANLQLSSIEFVAEDSYESGRRTYFTLHT